MAITDVTEAINIVTCSRNRGFLWLYLKTVWMVHKRNMEGYFYLVDKNVRLKGGSYLLFCEVCAYSVGVQSYIFLKHLLK